MASGRSGASKLYQSPLERQLLIKQITRCIKERLTRNVEILVDKFQNEDKYINGDVLTFMMQCDFEVSQLREYLEENIP